MNRKKFVAEKIKNFKAFLTETCGDDDKILKDINRLSENSTEAVIIYFNGLAENGCTADEYMKVICKHVKVEKYTKEQMDKFKAYIEMFLAVCK